MSAQRKTREEIRKEKQLEEARKAGTAAPEVDEEGRDINPHIPQYIAKAPWYLNSGQAGLKHQRLKNFAENVATTESINTWYPRGEVAGPAATKYRKGACTNCGAMTHKAKECTERPRKIGAKFKAVDIKPDEIVTNLQLDYAGKHDRWNGYDAESYKHVMEQYEAVEEERTRRKAEEQALKYLNDKKTEDEDNEDDEFKEAETAADKFAKQDSKNTVRDLRIREDIAKYLRNLDPNSAFYDPKSRSMRDNPYKNDPQKAEENTFVGDNFVRLTGDAQKFYEMQKFAWDEFEAGNESHLQAVPSQAETVFKKVKTQGSEDKKKQMEELLEQYGGKEHLTAPPKDVVAQTEQYFEYGPDGKIIKGDEPERIVRSKWEEDVFLNNHTKVWGSYWHDGQWGFACCHQFVKNSYCTGLVLKKEVPLASDVAANENNVEEKSDSDSNSASSDSESEDKKKKKKEKKSKKDKKDKSGSVLASKKRKYNSMADVDVSEKDMEDYRNKRVRFDDPMKDFVSGDK
jgi:pre-mRNA-processing factor SLU7